MMEASVTPAERQVLWVATENLARFQRLMDGETDTCQRKYLEALIVLEREKLRALNAPHQ